jgi:hypothetical protein
LHGVAWWRVGFVAAALGLACKRTPPEKTPEGTLALLRDALVTGRPPVARVADTRLAAESMFLIQARGIGEHSGIILAPSMVALRTREIADESRPERFFAGVRTLLGNGRCTRLGDAPLPPSLATTPEADPGWPRSALDLQVSVSRRMVERTAGDYRCEEGRSFRAAFVRPDPNDGTWRVAYIGPSGRP